MQPILAALPIVVMLSPCARADWAYTTWGMTPEQVVGASKGAVKIVPLAARYRNEEDHWEIAAQGTHKDGTLNFDVGFTFDIRAGGLKCVMYSASGADVALLKNIMIAHYDAPKKESSFLGSQSFEWTTPDKIELTIGQKPVAGVVTHCAP